MEIIAAVFLCLLVVGLCTAERGQLIVRETFGGVERPRRQLFPSRTPGTVNSRARQARRAVKSICDDGYALRIVGGEKAKIGEFPWQVGIMAGEGWYCGGSILTATWVLTAGHCVFELYSFSMLFGSLGRHVYDEGSVQRVSTEYILHGNYEPLTTLNDIALIRTASLTFTDTLKPVRLPGFSLRSRDLRGEHATVCGWGRISDKKLSTGHCLLCVSEFIIDASECQKYFPPVSDEQHICLDASNARGSCAGDSGGPLVLVYEESNSIQVGIMSFGSDYCEDGTPGVYVRVSNYLDWIKEHSDVEIDP